MNKRERKACQQLKHYLELRRDLAINNKLLHIAMFERFNKLSQIAIKIEEEDPFQPGSNVIYAWQIEKFVNELRLLLYEL